MKTVQASQECHLPVAQVTYDLGIAHIAYREQELQRKIGKERVPPIIGEFDKCLIHLGGFHIMQAYWGALGKTIDECGLPSIMIDSRIIAQGSLPAVMAGKHFNRAKHVHTVTLAALQSLHFEAFLTETGRIEVSNEIQEYLKEFQKRSSTIPVIEDENVLKLLEDYERYYQDTLEGRHGQTAKFYLIYMDLVKNFLLLSRSIRTGDFALYKYILPHINDIFFACGNINYARWLVHYHSELLKVDEHYPELKEKLENGAFGIRRTNKPFSRQPIDLVLEQTINQDAGRRLTGITTMRNSIHARQRWAESHAFRSRVISHTLAEAGMQKKEESSVYLGPSRIKKCREQIDSLIANIEERRDPFDFELRAEPLINIATGESAEKEVAESLLNIKNFGKQEREKFIVECQATKGERFNVPVKKHEPVSFAKKQKKKRIAITDKVRLQRNLFGRLLGIALKKEVNIAKVLSYPLTPVPLSLCKFNGDMNKTTKSTLTAALEKISPTSITPEEYDAVMIDGFFFLRLLPKDLQSSMGMVALQILKKIVSFPANNIHIVFDTYADCSIKDVQHQMRNNVTTTSGYNIRGPQTERPVNFRMELKNSNFKRALLNFLIDYWGYAPEVAGILGDKILYVDYIKCYKYQRNYDSMKVDKVIDPRFEAEKHEEADTKIIHHVHRSSDNNKKILIRASDTDILVIMLANMEFLGAGKQVFMDTGVGSKRRTIDVSAMFRKVTPETCAALPGFHALTGCDYNPSFQNKGKLSPFKLLQKSSTAKEAFKKLSNPQTYRDPAELQIVFDELERFVCAMYGHPKIGRVNECREQTFIKKFVAKNDHEKFMKDVGNYDGSALPPCATELKQHMRRTAYITRIWGNASLPDPTNLKPMDWGWTKDGGRYIPRWYEGDMHPQNVHHVIAPLSGSENDAEEIPYENESDFHDLDDNDFGIDSEDEI